MAKKKKIHPYGKVNVKMFRAIQKHILEEPKRLDMKRWGIQQDDYSDVTMDWPPCGTVACICGWTNYLHSKKTKKSCDFCDIDKAMQVLTLNNKDSYAATSDIFYVEHWPTKYRTAYNKAKTPAGRARVTSNFIDYICS